ncbi:MAG: CPBP family intramembrane metalloprotease [Flavobacteriales bacterium]|nr:CPBP family intramembrane metalloprotease [Flavobacteriales bacterium]
MRPHFYTANNTQVFFYFIASAILCSAVSFLWSMVKLPNIWWIENASTVLSSVITFGLPAVIFWKWITAENIGRGLHMANDIHWRSVVYSIILVFVMMPLVNYLISFSKDFLEYSLREDLFESIKATESMRESMINSLTANKAWYTYPVVMITLAVVPALVEEAFFRGTLQRLFLRQWHKKHIAVILTSLIFTMMHMDYFNWVGIMLCSVIMGYLYFYTSSLWCSIAFHFVSNAWNITMMYLLAHFPPEENVNTSHISPWMALLSAFFVWFIFRTMRSVNFMERKLKKTTL